MTPPAPSEPKTSSRYALYVFVLLFLLYLFDYIDRLIVVSLFPFIKADWGLTDTQLGLLVSAVYWSILFFTLPAAVLVDRWSRKKSIGLMSLIWGMATITCAFTRNFTQLFTARTFIGIGEAGYAPGGTAMISAIFPEEKRARMLGIWNASIPLGSALGIALGGFIAEHFGWRHAFGVVALPGMLVAILFFFIRDYKTIELVKTVGHDGQAAKKQMNFKDVAHDFLRAKSLIFNNLGFSASVFLTTGLMTWLPSYFHRYYGLNMTDAGVRGGLVMALAVVGAPVAGFLTDRWYKKNPRSRLLFPAASALATAIIFTVAFSIKGPMQYWVMLLGGVMAVGFVPGGISVTQDVVHPGLRAVSVSLNVIIQHLLGSTLGTDLCRFHVRPVRSGQGLFLPAGCHSGRGGPVLSRLSVL